MTNFVPNDTAFRSLEASSQVNAFVCYDSQRLIRSKLIGSQQRFLNACRGIQQIATNVGESLNAELLAIEFEGIEEEGDRGIFRRYKIPRKNNKKNTFMTIVVVTEGSLDELRDELNQIEEGTRQKYRGNWV